MLPAHESTKERYRRLEKIIPITKVVVTLDNHDAWHEPRDGAGADGGETGAIQVVEQVVEDALVSVDLHDIPAELRDQLQAHGTLPGGDVDSISPHRGGSVDWRLLLRRYVGQVLEVRPIFTRPPRRFPDMVGIIPGRGRRGSKPRVMAVIDTSASITPALLTLIDGELRLLAKHHAVTIVECDAAIQRVYPYRPLDVVWGRGGTDLRPPLQRAFLRQHRADLVVYFTDGHGPADEHRPVVPVIWCLVPGGKRPAAWGKKIHIHPTDVRKK
jgi:predicted metal-dependent peptidase